MQYTVRSIRHHVGEKKSGPNKGDALPMAFVTLLAEGESLDRAIKTAAFEDIAVDLRGVGRGQTIEVLLDETDQGVVISDFMEV